MRTDRIWRGALIGALVFAAAAVWRLGDGEAFARPVMHTVNNGKVATIDINAVLTNLDERIAREEVLKTFFEELEENVRRIEADLQQVQTDLGDLTAGTPQYQEKRNQHIRLRLRYEGEAQLARALAEERRKVMHWELFQKIVAATAEYADREGICIVLNDDSHVEIPYEELTGNQLQATIVGRRAIYACPDGDISMGVAQMMNNKYRAGG